MLLLSFFGGMSLPAFCLYASQNWCPGFAGVDLAYNPLLFTYQCLHVIDMLTCMIGLTLLLFAWRAIQIGLQQEMQYDITQQLKAQEAAVSGFPLSPHRCCQGWQQVRQHCFVMHHNLVTVLTQGFQALEQHCLQGLGIVCFEVFLPLFPAGLQQEFLL